MRDSFKRFLVPAFCMAIVAAFALAGCGGSQAASSSAAADDSAVSAEAVELNIFAANSLQKALPEVQALYTQKNPTVTFGDTQFEGSNALVTKLQEGASADVLITASKGSMDKAADLIDEGTRVDMFANDLIVCTKAGSGLTVASIEDLATNDAIESIAIGDPNVVPAGDYAVQAFESAGLATCERDDKNKYVNIEWDASIADKINSGADKVGTVASYVSEGTCTVGLVYTSDLYRYEGIESLYTTPADSHKSILYPGAVVADSQNAEVAADFINFCLTDPDAQAVFSQYGFELV